VLGTDSAAFYNQKIAQLEEEQLDWLNLIREQTVVVRSTKEWTLTRKLHQILKFINVGRKKTQIWDAHSALLLTLNDSATGIQQATVNGTVIHNTVIQMCLHWRNIITQTQVLTTKSSDSNPENQSGQLSTRLGVSSCTEQGLTLCTI
jgi:hypothetical protein